MHVAYFLRALAIAFFISVAGSVASAQIETATSTTSPPIHGVGHDYINLLSETVNPATGALSITIGMPVPPARGLTLPFRIAYNSSTAHFLQARNMPNPTLSAWMTDTSSLTSGGWSYAIPMFSATEHSTPSRNPATPNETCYYYTGWTLRDAQSQIHPLGLVSLLTPTEFTCNNTIYAVSLGGDGHYQGALVGTNDLAVDPSGTVYEVGNNSLYVKDRNGNDASIQFSSLLQ